MSFVITVYALLTISYFAVLPLEVIGATKIIATKVGEVAMGQAGIIVIPILVICSAFGATNASIYSNSRLIAASAEEGILLPKVLAKSVQLFNKTNVATSNNNSIASSSSSSLNGTAAAPAATTTTETFSEGSDAPVNSLILTCILTCGFCWVPELDTLIDISSFIQCIFTFLAVAGLIVLRYTHPEMHRPFRVFTPCAYLFCLVTLGLIIYPIADAIMDQSFDKAMPFLISIGLMLLPLPMIYYGVKRRADAFVY